MTSRPPDFDDLVGTDLDASERARLERVHHALIEAGPPPELPPRLSTPRRQRRPAGHAPPPSRARAPRGSVAVGAFAIGFLVADSGGPSTDRVIALTGAGGATASLVVFEIDDAGNWPMELEVEGLEPATDGGRYQLWLTKEGSSRRSAEASSPSPTARPSSR